MTTKAQPKQSSRNSGKPTVLRRFMCWLLGHKPVVEEEVMYVRQCHCSRCKQRMIGAYMQGELTKEWFWVYVVD